MHEYTEDTVINSSVIIGCHLKGKPREVNWDYGRNLMQCPLGMEKEK
jgi:hypothetical protein